jgi:protease I
VADVAAGDLGGLVLPGGRTHPDKMRLDNHSVALVRAVVQQRKPIAAICHGPWTLVEAGAVRGKALTSWPSLRTDIINAGGIWQNSEVVARLPNVRTA